MKVSDICIFKGVLIFLYVRFIFVLYIVASIYQNLNIACAYLYVQKFKTLMR